VRSAAGKVPVRSSRRCRVEPGVADLVCAVGAVNGSRRG
jgi:hypothetical protein